MRRSSQRGIDTICQIASSVILRYAAWDRFFYVLISIAKRVSQCSYLPGGILELLSQFQFTLVVIGQQLQSRSQRVTVWDDAGENGTTDINANPIPFAKQLVDSSECTLKASAQEARPGVSF
ncbi:hypothetical protein [Aeromonas sp. QDB21]|uniref:hypothetical protein n=1 Tax=Aeromonas sp. QDB21 TaxID=2990487 RepID=UPI0022DF3DD2|nr:hypothetical protein [Aeromonas sp. QDB21]